MNANGGRTGDRPVAAEESVTVRATRPKTSKLVDNPALRSLVEKLVEFWSPEQTALHDLPAEMRRSLAWDQGKEIHGHEALARSAGLIVYVCNPHSPRQRKSNENTNGLLRQWFPRSTDFYLLDRKVIAAAQTSLNDRPRHTLGFRTPADVLATACRHERAPTITPTNDPRPQVPD